MQIGLIGFGRLGKLITRYLALDSSLYVYDVEDHKKEIKELGAIPDSLEEVSRKAIVIVAVPISAFEDVIKSISNYLPPDTLVVDVCSVKQTPMEQMEKYLPSNVQILGTHPMFGPDSAFDTLFGTKIVLCKQRINEKLYTNIKLYLEKNGIRVIESTALDHDKQISSTLFLTHLIGRSLLEFGADDMLIDTRGYKRLRKILLTVQNDSWQLFKDMRNYNSFADETIGKFSEALQITKEKLFEK